VKTRSGDYNELLFLLVQQRLPQVTLLIAQ
jgi:hypothetical protein